MAGSVSYTITDRDLEAALRAHFVRAFRARRNLGQLGLVIGILSLGAFSLNIQSGQSLADSAQAAAIVGLCALGGGLALSLLSYLTIGIRVRRLFQQQRSLREATAAIWSDDGLEVRNAVSTIAMPWRDYHAWQANPHGYLVFISDPYLFLLPRQAFSDALRSDFERTITASGLARRGAPARARRTPAPPADPVARSGRRWTRWLTQAPPPRPGLVALLWIVSTALDVAAYLLFRDAAYETQSILYLSGALVLGGLLAGWALRLRAAALALVEALLQITIAYQIVEIALTFCLTPRFDTAWLGWLSPIPALASIAVIWCRYRRHGAGRRLAAIFLLFLALACSSAFYQADRWFAWISMQARAAWHLEPPANPDIDAMAKLRDIPPDRLWGAQPGLITRAVAGFAARDPVVQNVYAMAVAGDGTERLFTREARLALQVAAARYGKDYRGGVLLSNHAEGFLKTPFATQDNMAAAARGMAARIDPVRDLAFVYLASHGSRDAEITTDTATYDQLTPISSASVAATLARAGVKRRVIIVSACFAGSWIPALADDDTIVIAAARRDRTSFGCDDSLRLTYFGHAFLEGPLAGGASLHEAFDAARAEVTRLETAHHLTPSEPQAYVGRNMQALWNARRAVSR